MILMLVFLGQYIEIKINFEYIAGVLGKILKLKHIAS